MCVSGHYFGFSPFKHTKLMFNKSIFNGILIPLFFALTLFPACDLIDHVRGEGDVLTEERAVKGFDALDIDVPGKVIVHRGPDYKVIVKCEETIISYLETVVNSDDHLHICFSEHVYDVDDLEIIITAPEFKGFEINGSAEVICDDPLDGDDLNLDISGSGNIELTDVDYKEINAEVSGSGDVLLKGIADRLIFNVSGSGDLDAEDCPVKEADIRVSGSGSVRCNVSDKLKARISGSGNVWYKGNPDLNVDISGSGKVRKL